MNDDLKTEFFDETQEKNEIEKAKTLLNFNQNNPDTFGKFAKVLDTKMVSGMGKSGAPVNPPEARKEMLNFVSSSGSWKYVLGLILFFLIFIVLIVFGLGIKIFLK